MAVVNYDNRPHDKYFKQIGECEMTEKHNELDALSVGIEGHVKAYAYDDETQLGSDSGDIVLDKRNAVHNENASILIARALANRENGAIYSMHFGTGGATVDALGYLLYASPNVTGTADINVPVYMEVVDDNNNAPSGNQMSVRHINGTLTSDIEIRCVLNKNEPFGQDAFDNVAGTNINETEFAFDEIGLKTEDGLLVTHVVFSPVQKSANRIIEVVYTLRIRINS